MTAFNSSGQTIYHEQRLDNGGKILTQYDHLGNQSWQSIEEAWSGTGVKDYQMTHFDNGKRHFKDWDLTNSHDWSANEHFFDTVGKLEKKYVDMDNGFGHDTIYDVNNQFNWKEKWQVVQWNGSGWTPIRGGEVRDNGQRYDWNNGSATGVQSWLPGDSFQFLATSSGWSVGGSISLWDW